jgi:hypothetical protein
MLELFPDQPVYEYPQLVNVIYCFVWGFVLSAIIAITHRLTFTGEYYPKKLFSSLILGSIVTAMVMMAIGDSLARGSWCFWRRWQLSAFVPALMIRAMFYFCLQP